MGHWAKVLLLSVAAAKEGCYSDQGKALRCSPPFQNIAYQKQVSTNYLSQKCHKQHFMILAVR